MSIISIPFEGEPLPAIIPHSRVGREALAAMPRPSTLSDVQFVSISDWNSEHDEPLESTAAQTPLVTAKPPFEWCADFLSDHRGHFVDCTPYLNNFFAVSPEFSFVALYRSVAVGIVQSHTSHVSSSSGLAALFEYLEIKIAAPRVDSNPCQKVPSQARYH